MQRVVAGVPRACPDLSTIVVEEAAAPDEPVMRWQTGGSNIPTDLTRAGGQELATAELLEQFKAESLTATLLLKHVEAERLQNGAISEEESKLLEEQIEEKQREAAKAAAIAAAVDAAVAAAAAAAELRFPKDSLVTSEALEFFPPVPGQEPPPAYRSQSRSGSVVTAGSSSEAACRSPEATSESSGRGWESSGRG